MGDSKYDHPLEGSVYEKFEGTGDGNVYNKIRNSYYILYRSDYDYFETPSGTSWLRSLYGDEYSDYHDYYGYVVYLTGKHFYLRPDLGSGVSVGFTLKR